MGADGFVESALFEILNDPQVPEIEIGALGSHENSIGQGVQISFHLLHGLGQDMQIRIEDENRAPLGQVDPQVPGSAHAGIELVETVLVDAWMVLERQEHLR